MLPAGAGLALQNQHDRSVTSRVSSTEPNRWLDGRGAEVSWAFCSAELKYGLMLEILMCEDLGSIPGPKVLLGPLGQEC